MTKWKKCETCGAEMVGIKDTPTPVRCKCTECENPTPEDKESN